MAGTTREALDRIKRLTAALVLRVQKVLVTVSLFLLYIVGFGLTRALAAVFQRRLLAGRPADAESFWLEAEGYEADAASLARGS